MLRNWKEMKVGDKLRWYGKEFDGSWDEPCVVVEKREDCLIADCSGITLTIDDWSKGQFKIDK